MDIREYNLDVIKKYKLLKEREDLSFPLLVSSDPMYLQKLNSNKKVLYIGQETHTWINYDQSKELDVSKIEYRYFEFLLEQCTNSENFWRFIRNIIDIDKEEPFNNLIWSNALIAGKRYGKGSPNFDSDLKNISIQNLIYLYNYFKPECTIIVSGPRNPYYEIVEQFLKEVNSKISGEYPRKEECLISDCDKNIHYTYHPNYLNRSNQFNDVAQKIKKYL